MKKKYTHAPVTVVLIISLLCSVLALESTSPSLMWSPHINLEVKERVNYETLSSKELAKSVMCKGEKAHDGLDLAVVFMGKELHSLDVSGKTTTRAALVDLLKDAFLKSNFAMAYPYISSKVKVGLLENSLIEEFEELCGHKLGVNNIIVSESCSVEDQGYSKVADIHTVQRYLASKKDNGQPDLLIYCFGGFDSLKNLDQLKSECDILSELTSSLDQSGVKYVVLYFSNPYNPIRYPSGYRIARLLAEASSGNGSSNSTLCDRFAKSRHLFWREF